MMNGLVGPADVERFRTAVAQRLGLQFDDGKLGFLGEVLQRRLGRLGRSSSDYLSSLEDNPSRDAVGALAQELTVNETYFFRNNEQFRAFAEVVLHERMRVERTPKVLRFLSAGCASGEEAYSIAIVTRETILDPSWDVLIRAVDLDPAALDKAEKARYSPWAMRETPLDVQQKWFRPEGREMVLIDAARMAVQFEQRNLVVADSELWRPAAYDAIFCRNVIMYFAPEPMRAVVARMAQALAPGGFLFLGHAETLRGLSDDFHLRHTHETFYYERKQSDEQAVVRAMPVFPSSIPGVAPDTALTDAWVDAIRNASERIATLIPAETAAEWRPSVSSPAWDRAGTLELLRGERFGEALAQVRQQAPEADRDPDKLLLEATLLAHAGEIEAAADACHRLLSIDELNAGAHYVLALCREQAGDRGAAGEHDRVAIYLDPGFAMPRLHLGLMARRSGDHGSARRELGWALVLLKREDASRLLLFGGGFNRDALIALCESALRSCGERS
jgi:chemotaxis protein methyltransferase CheR